jgi:hypothetical protein
VQEAGQFTLALAQRRAQSYQIDLMRHVEGGEDEVGKPRREHFVRRRRIVSEVGLRRGRAIASLFEDRAAHDHDPLYEARQVRVVAQARSHVGEGPERDERHLPRQCSAALVQKVLGRKRAELEVRLNSGWPRLAERVRAVHVDARVRGLGDFDLRHGLAVAEIHLDARGRTSETQTDVCIDA